MLSRAKVALIFLLMLLIGAVAMATEGTLILDQNGWKIFDLGNGVQRAELYDVTTYFNADKRCLYRYNYIDANNNVCENTVPVTENVVGRYDTYGSSGSAYNCRFRLLVQYSATPLPDGITVTYSRLAYKRGYIGDNINALIYPVSRDILNTTNYVNQWNDVGDNPSGEASLKSLNTANSLSNGSDYYYLLEANGETDGMNTNFTTQLSYASINGNDYIAIGLKSDIESTNNAYVCLYPGYFPPSGTSYPALILTYRDNQSPTVNATYPTGGVVLFGNNQTDITWTASDNMGINHFDMYYSNDNGASWQDVALNVAGSLRNFTWVVPNINSTDCKIKIEVTDNAGLTATSTTTKFEIKQSVVSITFPTGGVVLYGTNQSNITWTAPTNIGINRFDIYFSNDNGTNWQNVALNVDCFARQYAWDVPNINSLECRVKIVATDNAGLTATSITSKFEIKQSVINITYPNGDGVVLFGNDQANITWTAPIDIGITHFDIYYSNDNGASWQDIALNVAGSLRNYTWVVPNINSTVCRVKIVATDNAGLTATSTTSKFEIAQNVYPQNKWIKQYTGTKAVKDIQMIDDKNGWAVGNDGLVLHSSSGAWSPADLGLADYNLNDVEILKSNTQYGWIVGENKSDNTGVLRRTIDGGAHWPAEYEFTMSGVAFKSVSFSGNGKGYIACGNGIILYSRDYGATWMKTGSTPIPTSDGVSIWYQSIYTDPTNSNNVRVVGDNYGIVATSYDGGITWPTQITKPLSEVSISYTWPANTEFNKTLALAPNKNYSADWNNYDISYNHGWHYSPSTSFQQVASAHVWLSGSYVYPSYPSVYAGSDGYIAPTWLQSLENNVNINAISGISGYTKYLGASNGEILNNRYYGPTSFEALDPSCIGGPQKITIEVNPLASVEQHVLRYEVFRATSAIGSFIKLGVMTNKTFVDNTAQYLMDYYYCIRVVHVMDSPPHWVLIGSCRPTSGLSVPTPPIAPTTLTVTDVPNDHGKVLTLNWQGSSVNGYYIGRKLVGESKYQPLAMSSQNNYTDATVQNGLTYCYVVQAYGNIYQPSANSNEATGYAVDNIAPNTLPMQTGYYDAAIRIITLNWQPSVDDPNFGGYWLCPEALGEFASIMYSNGGPGGYTPDAYHVEHASPLQRTTYKYYVPDNYLGQTLGFSITAMDRSGNIAPWSPTFAINTNAFTNSNYAKATAYNNGRHLLYDDNGKLHLTYTSDDSVFYKNSIDDGYTWSGSWATGPGFEACGTKPSSVIGIYGVDTTLVWKAETQVGGWVLKSAQRDNSYPTKWTDPQTILEQGGGYEQGHVASPPAMVVNNAGTHLTVERIDSYTIPGGQTGYWHWKVLYGFKAVGQSVYTWTILDSAQGTWGGGPIDNPASPTICIDPKGGIHVAWDWDGEIYWRVYDSYSGVWKSKINLSNSPDVVSDEPSLALYGDVNLVWQEGNDIFHNRGNWGLQPASKNIDRPFSWQGSENVSNNPGTASLNPVYDGNYIAWSEQSATKPDQYNASFASYNNFQWTVVADYSKNPTQPSVYPQIAYRQNADGNKMTTIWTEGTGPLYSLIARDSTGVSATPQFAAELGGEEASIYTIQRDGYLTYTKNKSSTITVDYDSTGLLYYLPYLDKEQKQNIKMAFYQVNGKNEKYQYKIYIDDMPLGVINVPSGQTVILEKNIPNNVTHDGEGILKIENKKGEIATCDWWELYAYDKSTGKGNGGGAQSEMGEAKQVAYSYELMQNAPNPCSRQTMINYQLAKQGQVSLTVYNTLGQVVKTLVKETQNPGRYSIKWKGNDETGRQVAAGIYFYRLASGEFNATKKLVVLK